MMGGEGLEDAYFDGECGWLGPVCSNPREGGEKRKNVPKTRKSVGVLKDFHADILSEEVHWSLRMP